MRARELVALAVLGLVVVITAVWWGLALWPFGPGDASWLARARLVCFGAPPGELPDAAGWLSLIGQPVMMLGMVLVLWGDAVAGGLRALARAPLGRGLAAGATVAALAAVSAAALRVVDARAARMAPALATAPRTMYPRLDRPAPALRLVDQDGDTVALEALRGRPVLVAFAYAHCRTVCPLVVHDVLVARRRAAADSAVALIVTLDPRRDAPARLPSIAARWGLDVGERVMSGPVPEVEAALRRWGVAWRRDPRTGEVTHAAVVYVIDREGRIAYAVPGGADAIAGLIGSL